jgi:hypothetical protein
MALDKHSDSILLTKYPDIKYTVIGGGILGLMEAITFYLKAKQQYLNPRITVFEKNGSTHNSLNPKDEVNAESHSKNPFVFDTTVQHLFPSITKDEMASVVPTGAELQKKLEIPFNEPGGIKVTDVPGVNDSIVAKNFIDAVIEYSKDAQGNEDRLKALLSIGSRSTKLWEDLYNMGDDEFKKIMEESNYNPCRDSTSGKQELHNGYRIDLIYNIKNAALKAEGMKKTYEDLGATNCKILTPEEVLKIDSSLTDFCAKNTITKNGVMQWKNDAVALWRPGGCIDTQTFLPKAYAWLEKICGQYTNKDGKIKNAFRLKSSREVLGVVYQDEFQKIINGLKFQEKTSLTPSDRYIENSYVFCPGSDIGTLDRFGFKEPAYAGFAGTSLTLTVPITEKLRKVYDNGLNHCMEVHQEGVVLAWQAREKDGNFILGVAGTKAFYGDQKPKTEEAFCINRNVLQLNMMNDVHPALISAALGLDTYGKQLREEHLRKLEKDGYIKRWVGTRAVAYDGFPTLGYLYHKENGHKIENGFVNTHAGSGGNAFAPGVCETNYQITRSPKLDECLELIAKYSSSARTPFEGLSK